MKLMNGYEVIESGPTSVVSEQALLHGYRNYVPPRTEPCACGVDITSFDSEKEIARTLRAHYLSTRHMIWRRRQ